MGWIMLVFGLSKMDTKYEKNTTIFVFKKYVGIFGVFFFGKITQMDVLNKKKYFTNSQFINKWLIGDVGK